MSEAFCDRLRQAIGSRSKRAIAKAAGMDRADLLRVLRAKSKLGPTLSTVETLARATGVSPGWLAFGEP